MRGEAVAAQEQQFSDQDEMDDESQRNLAENANYVAVAAYH